MSEYFKIQFLRILRRLSDGNNLIVSSLFALVIVFLFILASAFLFEKTELASYIYVFIGLYFVSKLSEIKRNDFLKICFNNRQYRKIRITENLVITFPFIIFLIFKNQFYIAIIFVVVSVLMSVFNFRKTYEIVVPTPFSNKPFEFCIGFRNTYFIFAMIYALTVIAMVVNNYNIGIFSLILIFLVVISYYTKSENEYIVWIYSLTPAKFLLQKLKTAFIYTAFLYFPILLSLVIFDFSQIHILFLFSILGYMYLTAILLAKYSTYPDEIDLIHGIIIGLCVLLPPMLVLVIPFLANRAVNNLKTILK